MALTPIIQLYTSDPTIPGSTAVGYMITEHNRQPMGISYDRIEQSSRMADGTMRRFITANKKNISLSWDNVTAAAGTPFTADGNLGGAFLKSFYEENVYNPIWIKLTYAEEAWRFANINAASSLASRNPTFNTTRYTAASVQVPSAFRVASVAFGAFSNGISTASVFTSVSTTFSSSATVPEIYLSGLGQLFNGTWFINSSTPTASLSTMTFRFGADNNASAIFKINSYVQTGSSATFNVDNTEYIQNGASFVVSNSQYLSGSSINGTWKVIAAPTSSTSFTASSTSSQTGAGRYGDAAILYSPSFIKSVSAYPAITGPAVSSDIIKVFITDFSYDIQKRYDYTDIVNVSMKFTEI